MSCPAQNRSRTAEESNPASRFWKPTWSLTLRCISYPRPESRRVWRIRSPPLESLVEGIPSHRPDSNRGMPGTGRPSLPLDHGGVYG